MNQASVPNAKAGMKVLHVLGTNTDVGKTHVVVELLKAASALGRRALPIKPIHSGWSQQETWGCDLEPHVDHIKGLFEDMKPEQLCAYRFEEPMSPYGAAMREGRSIELEKLQEHWSCWRAMEDVDVLVVEGIGGVMCPLNQGFTYLDWLKGLDGGVLLVASVGLGTLNHTLLSLKALAAEGIEVSGVLLNQERFYEPEDVAAQTCRLELELMTEVPIFGPLKHGDGAQHQSLIQSLLRELNFV